MTTRTIVRPTFVSVFSIALLFLGAWPSLAVERQDDAAENLRHVRFFEAMKEGDIEVKFIPRDATRANLLVKNNTKTTVAHSCA